MLKVKSDFPIFENNKDLIYLDSASTSQKPKQVIETLKNFYEKSNSNVQRGLYDLSTNAEEQLNQARKIIANFIEADKEEIIFTKNTTESINLLSNTIKSIIPSEKDEIVLTEMEHHSNLVPWQEFAKKHGFTIKFIPLKEDLSLNYEEAEKIITEKTAFVSITAQSNVTGTINHVDRIIKLAKQRGALSIIDVAQYITHSKVSVKFLDCDFLAFSSHKLLGPNGVGILYAKKDLIEKLPPFQFGGGMINYVSFEESNYKENNEKFEAGTQDIAGIIGFAKAIGYINEIGIEKLEESIEELTNYALEKLGQVKNIKIYGKNQLGIISFNIAGIHPHDLASSLNEYGIAIRAGHHCAMPLMKILKANGTARISFQIYNSKEDINKLVGALQKIQNPEEKNQEFREEILEHYKTPNNFGKLQNATHSHKETNASCGDEITLQLIINNNKIEDVRFIGNGCAISMASASLLTEEIKDKTLEEIKSLRREDVLNLLKIPISPGRIKCALLSLEALRRATK